MKYRYRIEIELSDISLSLKLVAYVKVGAEAFLAEPTASCTQVLVQLIHFWAINRSSQSQQAPPPGLASAATAAAVSSRPAVITIYTYSHSTEQKSQQYRKLAISDAPPLEVTRHHSRPIMQQPTNSTIPKPPLTPDTPDTKFQQNLTVRGSAALL